MDGSFIFRIIWFALVKMVLLSHSVSAQSIHFSQAYSAHLTLNPANTGRFNGDWRAVVMHRQQGYRLSNDYQSSYFSFEHPFYIRNENFFAGIYYARDNSAGNTLPSDRLNISVANAIRISHDAYLQAGLQVAWVHKQIDWSRITFPDQYNRDLGGFDPGLPTADQFENSKTSYLDVGFGLLYTQSLRRGPMSFGYSLQQINRPTETFFDDPYTLALKHVWHSKADLDLNARMFVIPVALFMKNGSASSSLVGLNIGHNLNEWVAGSFNSVLAGVHMRNADKGKARALIFSAGTVWQYWTFMLSYDSDISNTKTSRFTASGLELGVVYKLPSTRINRITVPCERY